MPRTKGALGRRTLRVKEAVLQALDELGGKDWLVEQANARPELFIGLLAKLLPRQIVADIAHEGELVISWKGEE